MLAAGPPLDSDVGDLELLAAVLHGGLLGQLGNFPMNSLLCVVLSSVVPAHTKWYFRL